jgi:hypothetical protein
VLVGGMIVAAGAGGRIVVGHMGSIVARIVGSIAFGFGLVEGLVAERRRILGLGFGLVARGLGSLIVGRRGCWRFAESCRLVGFGSGLDGGCHGRGLPMGCRRCCGWTFWWWMGVFRVWWVLFVLVCSELGIG